MQQHNQPLRPLHFQPLPLGCIQPAGWLQNQLRIQADGLSGHLDEFWSDVANSAWIGGEAEGWERGPYWLDGVIPLAFLLDDAGLKAKVSHWTDYIVEHQQPDGWLGPVRDQRYGEKYRAYDPWPIFVTLKALTQFYDATGDERIIPAIQKFLQRLDALLDEQSLFEWGKSRWADLVLSIHWLYDRTQESWLLDLASKAAGQGFDWRQHFANFTYTDKTPLEQCDQTTHVVNNAMAIKQPGVWYRQSQDEGDREAVTQIISTLDHYHGQATGVFTGDEHLAGKSPAQGTELCAVVEYMFSLETLIAILGEATSADRLERITYNALPATFSPDMCAHQYDQQANQVVCKVAEDRVYTNNGPDANIFGLEPHYGCCTANMHQGWPKFASHLWMKRVNGSGAEDTVEGLVAIAYAPNSVTTKIGNHLVQIDLQTDYPFDETLIFTVSAPEPVTFSLDLRIPAWTKGATMQVNQEPATTPDAGSFYRLERTWDSGDKVTLQLPMSVHITRRFNNSVSLSRGPLVYALPLDEDWRQIGRELPYADWEVYPASAWNYALALNETDIASLHFEQQPIGSSPFSPHEAPIKATVQGRRLPQWGLAQNAAAPPPPSPASSDEPLETLTLIPYGCTNLRVTEFPNS